MSEVPCTIADDLSEKQVMEYRIADNATAEIAIWDKILLSKEMASFAETKSTDGFSSAHIGAAKADFQNISDDIEPQETCSFFTVVFNDKASRDKFQAFLKYAKKVHPDLTKEVALLTMLENELNE
jgi:hypothetical protein